MLTGIRGDLSGGAERPSLGRRHAEGHGGSLVTPTTNVAPYRASRLQSPIAVGYPDEMTDRCGRTAPVNEKGEQGIEQV